MARISRQYCECVTYLDGDPAGTLRLASMPVPQTLRFTRIVLRRCRIAAASSPCRHKIARCTPFVTRCVPRTHRRHVTIALSSQASFMLIEPDLRRFGCDYFAFGSDRLPFDGSKGQISGYPPYTWGINRCGCEPAASAQIGTSHALRSPHIRVGLLRCHQLTLRPLRPLHPVYAPHRRCVAKGAWADIKPVSYFCPVACGCHAGDEHCPDQCPSRNETSTELCPSYQKILANDYPASTACAVGPAPDASPR